MPSPSLTVFAEWFGTTVAELPAELLPQIENGSFDYSELLPSTRDAVILKILSQLDGDVFAPAGAERHGIWEKAWAERAAEFAASQNALSGLTPTYIDANPIVRLNGDYVQPSQPGFEWKFSNVFRPWLFNRYLSEPTTVYEFGCGSGFNLALLAQLYPEKQLVGLDWALPSVKLVNALAAAHGYRLSGRLFDFFAPDPNLTLQPASGVMTMCALEQVGAQHELFLDFLLNQKPRICVHMEPISEFYQTDSLVDYLAHRYHTQRNYLNGWLSRLQALEKTGRIKILAAHRVPFGSLYHEGYSYVVWQPT